MPDKLYERAIEAIQAYFRADQERIDTQYGLQSLKDHITILMDSLNV